VTDWATAKNLLCVRLDNTGDVLMTSPALRALKASCPDRRITLLGSSSGCAVARHIPEVDATVRYDAPWVKNSVPCDVVADRLMCSVLALRRFDAAVVFTVYSQSPLPAAQLCYLAGIPLRLAHCRENPYRLLTDWVRECEPQQRIRHEVERQLDLVAAVGARTADTGISFSVSPSDRRRAAAKLLATGVDLRREWIAMHPGASAPSRRYPPERFAAVASELVRTLDCQIVVTGDVAEAPLARDVGLAAGPSVHSVAGELDLGEFGAVLEGAALLVSNNTGPVHVASALGTPVVDLYALTNPQHTPWRVPHRVLFRDVPCKYCYRSVCPEGHHACLLGVPESAVAAAARELWEARPNRPRRAFAEPADDDGGRSESREAAAR
jgi:lipopolysaccharide heptosyltransferase II